MNTRITHTNYSEGMDKMTSCVCEFVCLFVICSLKGKRLESINTKVGRYFVHHRP